MQSTTDDLVTWQHVANRIGLKERAIWKLVCDAGLPHYRINARVIRFRVAEVEEWLKKRKRGE